MNDIWANDLFGIAICILLVIAWGVTMSWGAKHIGSDIVEIVKDAVKESRKGQIKVVR